MNRIRIKKRVWIVLGVLFLLWAGLCAYVLFLEPSMLLSRHVELRVDDPRWAGGLTIALVGDPHLRPGDGQRLERLIEAVNAMQSDLVLLVGDYPAGRQFPDAMPLEEIAAGLARMNGRLGTWAVLGNHDWWCGGEEVAAALRRHGIRVLRNEAAVVDLGGGRRINLAGVDDRFTGHEDWEWTRAALDPAYPVILMAHHPDIYPELSGEEVMLVLAGHTHGGQVRIPFVGPPVVPSEHGMRYAEGVIAETGRPLMFVTRGVGSSVLPLRFNCPPEVVLLTLRR